MNASRWIGNRRRPAIAALCGLLYVTIGAGAAGAQEARTLHFPEDRSMGTLRIRPAGIEGGWDTRWMPRADAGFAPDTLGWTELGEARGAVEVPAGVSVALDVSPAASSQLDGLDSLNAGDLQLLTVETPLGGAAGSRVTDDQLEHAGRLTGLRAISLWDTGIDGSGLVHLRGLTDLEELDLGGSKVEDSNLRYLNSLKNLRWLSLHATPVTDAAIEHLEDLDSLEYLMMNGTAVSGAGLKRLAEVRPNLRGLEISLTRIDSGGLAALAPMRLRHLRIGGDLMDGAAMPYVGAMTSLESLWIQGAPMEGESLGPLAQLVKLTDLMLYPSGGDIGLGALASLGALPALERLTLVGPDDAGIEALSRSASISWLSLGAPHITEASFERLRAMPSLTSLALGGRDLSDEFLLEMRAALPGVEVAFPRRPNLGKPLPAWREAFDRLYRLDEGEMIRRIAPPFIPERLTYYSKGYPGQAASIPTGPNLMQLRWTERGLEMWSAGFGAAGTSFSDILRDALGLRSFEIDGDPDALGAQADGDWIFREDALPSRMAEALERVAAEDFGVPARLVKRRALRLAIVARGKYRLRAIPVASGPPRIQIYLDDLENTYIGIGQGSVGDLLVAMGDFFGIPAIDETDPQTANLSWSFAGSSRIDFKRGDPTDRLEKILENVGRQTSLDFTLEPRVVEVWFVEKKEDK